ncbi:anaerobic ribonucleoside-triphosphate reductase [Exiguobacterium sp. SH5S4]|uniref:anaerobic ribonucleoside-triphosphate reductase n=1 Tax=Exiguobacterium sp. SH5S4 TaxID=2510961 RepID=UPI001375F37E|nr:anaerobic ribonucleoside-triphosphate reductase [Exiguobacterium sp. SH5S4]
MFEAIDRIINQADKDVTNENANVSGSEPQGIMAIMAGSVGQEYALEKLVDKDVAELHRMGYLHIHDLDYYPTGTTTCLQIPVGKLLKDGFSVKDSFMREPGNITSAFALVAVIFQIHQNMQHGGQAMSALDVDLAPYVTKTFDKHYKWFVDAGLYKHEALSLAKAKTIDETYQAAEAFVHNMNSMTSRGGGQTVFSSINFGLGTKDEERAISFALLRAMKNGLGKGEQPIFPIMIFQLKKGVNMYKGDPNYDLFEESLSVTAERFFPNYVFLDASFNGRHYDADRPETWAASMGCVDGSSEIVTDKGRVSIETLFNVLEVTEGAKWQAQSCYIEPKDQLVFDSIAGRFVKVLKVIKNPDQANWFKLTFSNGISIYATEDHPFDIVGKGRTFVSDINVSDEFYISKFSSDKRKTVKLTAKDNFGYRGKFSFDLETDSDRFDVNDLVSHNCRTRTLENVNGEARAIGRGNLSFTSINLPLLALESENFDEFIDNVETFTTIACEQLHDRYRYQIKRSPENFGFIYDQQTMVGAEDVKESRNLEDALKHGTLSVGFVGLAEAMMRLFGKHHAQDEEVLEKALHTIEVMKSVTDKYREALSLNYAVIATPAESFAGKALKKTVALHGVVEGVTDRDYFTNSFHIPVWHSIPYRKKLEVEGKFHELCLAGHISYVEIGEMPSGNIEAMKDIVYCMAENNIGYGAINIPVDKCNECRLTTTIYDECPKCGSKDIKRIRRITGYLVGDMGRWNGGKEAEERDRVKHV